MLLNPYPSADLNIEPTLRQIEYYLIERIDHNCGREVALTFSESLTNLFSMTNLVSPKHIGHRFPKVESSKTGYRNPQSGF